MLCHLEKEIVANKLLCENQRVLIGVSGGPDSIALLHALNRLAPTYQWELFVVHVDHQLRAESGDDARYVEECCANWNIPFSLQQVNVKGHIQSEGGSVQEVARTLRYQAFEEVASQWNISTLALAHHADDQVETVLMRLIRGTGVSGLMGIQMKRPWNGREIIRPLLSCEKKEIEEYCIKERLLPRIDSSNFSKDYVRNRMRIELLPLLNTYNPKFQDGILQLSDMVKEEEKVWEELVSKAYSEVVKVDEFEESFLQIAPLHRLPIALQRRTIKLILNSLMKESGEITLYAVEQVRNLSFQLGPSGKAQLPGRLVAQREYETIRFYRDVPHSDTMSSAGPVSIQLPLTGVMPLYGMIGEMELIQSDVLLEVKPSCRDWVVFDVSRLEVPFYARVRQEGDRMTCYGMNGSKKVKKVFIEEKVPVRIRDHYPIITTNKNEIVWIPGVRRSNYAPVDKDTSQFLYMFWYG